jgi:signal transduction histidine kinase
MRSLIFELRPGSLSEEGFMPALRRHIAAVEGRTGLVIRLDVGPDLECLPFPGEDALYRIAQEAIHNVVKHARAHEAGIRIAVQSATVRMTIRDDGIGFDLQSRRDGLGMAGMVARAGRIGGAVTVESAPDRGTVVTATLPTVGVGVLDPLDPG